MDRGFGHGGGRDESRALDSFVDPTLADGQGDVKAPIHHRRANGLIASWRKRFCGRQKIRCGIVDEPGQRPISPDQVQHFVDRLRISDVASDSKNLAASLLRNLRGGFFENLFAPPAYVNGGAMGGKTAGDFRAQPTTPTGHKYALIFKDVRPEKREGQATPPNAKRISASPAGSISAASFICCRIFPPSWTIL